MALHATAQRLPVSPSGGRSAGWRACLVGVGPAGAFLALAVPARRFGRPRLYIGRCRADAVSGRPVVRDLGRGAR